MRMVEHYVMINGKVICELVSQDEASVPPAGADAGPNHGSTSAMEFRNRVLRKTPSVPEAKESR